MIRTGKFFNAIFIFMLLPQLAFTQQFKYGAELNSVDTTGFYEIIITPAISKYLQTDFSDIRVAGENNQWVPHILQQVATSVSENLFMPFPILQNRINDSGKNLLIIENIKTAGINTLMLSIKNAAVSRQALLSGSYNQQDWYIIDDNININRSYEMLKDEYLQEINFPLAQYRYLKLVIDNDRNEPLLISKAGFYAKPLLEKPTTYQLNPAPIFIQKDSTHDSYILVNQGDSYQFDEISITTSGPRYYNRDVQLCLPQFDKNNTPTPGRIIGNFKLVAGTKPIFNFSRTKSPAFYLVIKNRDSPPLKIETISTSLRNIALVSYLEKGKKYKLLLGDSLASFADYDLQTFKDNITVKRILKYGKVYANTKNNFNKKTNNTIWWIWPAIILGGLVLSFLTYRLTMDLNKPAK